jgi:hypothetical protein
MCLKASLVEKSLSMIQHNQLGPLFEKRLMARFISVGRCLLLCLHLSSSIFVKTVKWVSAAGWMILSMKCSHSILIMMAGRCTLQNAQRVTIRKWFSYQRDIVWFHATSICSQSHFTTRQRSPRLGMSKMYYSIRWELLSCTTIL